MTPALRVFLPNIVERGVLRTRRLGHLINSVTWAPHDVQELFRLAAEARERASTLAQLVAQRKQPAAASSSSGQTSTNSTRRTGPSDPPSNGGFRQPQNPSARRSSAS
jgi:hypothetical protein